MLELVIDDLDFIRSRAKARSFDIWEEEFGYHYYTQLVQAEALARGAEWLAEAGDAALAGLAGRRRMNSYRASAPFGARATATTAQGLASLAASRKRLSTSRLFWRASRWSREGNAQRARPEGSGDACRARRPVRR